MEGVAFVLGWVAHAIDQHVASGRDRESAKADILVGAVLGCREGDAGGVVQRLFERRQFDIVHQLFRHDGHRLGNVPYVLLPLADAGRRRANRLLASCISCAGDLYRREYLIGGCRGLRPC